MARAQRLRIGAVIAHLPPAINRLQEVGFRREFTSADGTYLVRKPKKR